MQVFMYIAILLGVITAACFFHIIVSLLIQHVRVKEFLQTTTNPVVLLFTWPIHIERSLQSRKKRMHRAQEGDIERAISPRGDEHQTDEGRQMDRYNLPPIHISNP